MSEVDKLINMSDDDDDGVELTASQILQFETENANEDKKRVSSRPS